MATEDDELAQPPAALPHARHHARGHLPRRARRRLVLRDAGAGLQLPHHRPAVRARPQPARATRRLGGAAQRDRGALPRAARATRSGSSCRRAAPAGSLHGYHLFPICVRAGAAAARGFRGAARRGHRRAGALHPRLPPALLPRHARLSAGRVPERRAAVLGPHLAADVPRDDRGDLQRVVAELRKALGAREPLRPQLRDRRPPRGCGRARVRDRRGRRQPQPRPRRGHRADRRRRGRWRRRRQVPDLYRQGPLLLAHAARSSTSRTSAARRRSSTRSPCRASGSRSWPPAPPSGTSTSSRARSTGRPSTACASSAFPP